MTEMMEHQGQRSRLTTFAGWHRTEQLWREIYTRTVSALSAALVIYLVAALSGAVSRKPLPWILLIVVVGSVVSNLYQLRRYRRFPRVIGALLGMGLVSVGLLVWWIVRL